MRNVLASITVVLALASSLTGCAAEEEATGNTAGAAFTVESGDRFVVSAQPDKIVLKKTVDGVAFPFDAKELEGKAILIHPVDSRAKEGVYARAISVEDSAGKYTIESKPLTLGEMSSITEDEIVRIYIDTKRSKPAGKSDEGPVLVPASTTFGTLGTTTGGNVRPLGNGLPSLNGFAFTGFDLGSGVDFQTPIFLKPGITFKHTVEKASLTPQGLADWSYEEGLELGFKADIEWESTLRLGGKVAGEFFRSPPIEPPPTLVFVPIGPVPVPILIQPKAFSQCSASVTGPLEVATTLKANASFGASIKINPSTETAVSEWVKEGRWPATASGDFSLETTAESTWSASVACSIPRIEIHATVAGVAGPFMAIATVAKLSSDGAGAEVPIIAGVGAGMLGIKTGVEINLYTYKP